MKRRGFTIIELLMVIGILSVLVTITVTAVSGSMKRARTQQADALCTLVEQGITTYYAQYGKLPVEPGGEGNNQDDDTTYEYSAGEVREIMWTLIAETQKNNPMLDVSGLMVSRTNGERGTKGTGINFMTAIRGSKGDRDKMKLKQMYFGYPDAKTGHFRRFRMTYSPATDKIRVFKQ